MAGVLLLISQDRDSEKAVVRAVELAGSAKSGLTAAYVLDERFQGRVETLLSESTFVADKPGDDLCAALSLEYRGRGESRLKSVTARCAAAGIACRTEFLAGDYFEIARKLCGETTPDIVIASERSNALLMRLVGLSDRRRLERITGRAVEAY